MTELIATVKKWYLREIWLLDYVKDVFLVILRLYFGWGFISAGLGKLFNVEIQTEAFRDLGIPLPMLNVYLAGTTETVCGFLLMLGFASRLITIPLIGTMLVAYLTAHTDQLYAFWGQHAAVFQSSTVSLLVHLPRRPVVSDRAECPLMASSSLTWNVQTMVPKNQ